MNDEDRQRLQVLCAGILGLILFLGVARFAYTPLLPLMREQAGLGAAAGGWLAAANYAGAAMGLYKQGDAAGWFAAVVGSIVLLFVYSLIKSKSSGPSA